MMVWDGLFESRRIDLGLPGTVTMSFQFKVIAEDRMAAKRQFMATLKGFLGEYLFGQAANDGETVDYEAARWSLDMTLIGPYKEEE